MSALVGRALVTGGTAGLGVEFARQLAAAGHDLVLVARDEARLADRRAELSAAHGIDVEVLAADLSTDDGCAAVAARIAADEKPVDIVINNAGVGTYKQFGVAPLSAEEQQLDLNVRAVLRLTYAAVLAMTPRRRGHIINISSVAGFVPRGGNATYAASKAWVTLFTEALSIQLAGTGVAITAICPGFTHTEFHERAQADMSNVPQRMWLEAADVVREGLADAAKGKAISVPSRQYKALTTTARLLPRSVLRAVMARRGM